MFKTIKIGYEIDFVENPDLQSVDGLQKNQDYIEVQNVCACGTKYYFVVLGSAPVHITGKYDGVMCPKCGRSSTDVRGQFGHAGGWFNSGWYNFKNRS